MRRAADDSHPVKKAPLPLSELRQRQRTDAIGRFCTTVVDGLLALCRRAAAAIRAAWNTAMQPVDSAAAMVVDVDLAVVDVAVIVYIHHGTSVTGTCSRKPGRRLARELRGRRAQPGLDDRIVDAAIGAYCVDLTPPQVPGRRLRPPGHTVYTAASHPAAPSRPGGTEDVEDSEAELSVHGRPVATSIRIQSLLRASRASSRQLRPQRVAGAAKPSPADQATAAALCEQLAFGDVPDNAEDQDDGQEQVCVISPERLAWQEDLQERVGELAQDAPRAKASRKRSGRALDGRSRSAPDGLLAALRVRPAPLMVQVPRGSWIMRGRCAWRPPSLGGATARVLRCAVPARCRTRCQARPRPGRPGGGPQEGRPSRTLPTAITCPLLSPRALRCPKAARSMSAREPGRRGLGHPRGSRNQHKALVETVGKTVKRAESIKERGRWRG